ncbi:hypothetical protein OE88DRAFT_1651942 [Heliocybe sulcata]|uniref:Uncharacterized protein n=1 Tax=Heliocybe sulcata TaxID=5364 RepID=A0A5C3NE21_9AGAM|nr:hypothetical protein OE88DRAFT_1651942 [Heliocybe sulcata]
MAPPQGLGHYARAEAFLQVRLNNRQERAETSSSRRNTEGGSEIEARAPGDALTWRSSIRHIQRLCRERRKPEDTRWYAWAATEGRVMLRYHRRRWIFDKHPGQGSICRNESRDCKGEEAGKAIRA